jgi:hypothetical protein
VAGGGEDLGLDGQRRVRVVGGDAGELGVGGVGQVGHATAGEQALQQGTDDRRPHGGVRRQGERLPEPVDRQRVAEAQRGEAVQAQQRRSFPLLGRLPQRPLDQAAGAGRVAAGERVAGGGQQAVDHPRVAGRDGGGQVLGQAGRSNRGARQRPGGAPVQLGTPGRRDRGQHGAAQQRVRQLGDRGPGEQAGAGELVGDSRRHTGRDLGHGGGRGQVRRDPQHGEGSGERPGLRGQARQPGTYPAGQLGRGEGGQIGVLARRGRLRERAQELPGQERVPAGDLQAPLRQRRGGVGAEVGGGERGERGVAERPQPRHGGVR